jgi:hypothetical protein
MGDRHDVSTPTAEGPTYLQRVSAYRIAFKSAVSAAIVSTAGAVLLVPAGGAGASSGCIGWGQLPARVALGPAQVSVTATLRGTSSCSGVTFDNGGSGDLRGPNGADYPYIWPHLNGSDTATMTATVTPTGTYTIANGNVQTYDANSERIAYTWQATSTVVKYASRWVDGRCTGGTIAAILQTYGHEGWQNYAGVPVSLQRRTSSGWVTVERGHTDPSGGAAFRVPSPGTYQIVSVDTGSTWGSAY